jgi:hypothetical protein
MPVVDNGRSVGDVDETISAATGGGSGEKVRVWKWLTFQGF